MMDERDLIILNALRMDSKVSTRSLARKVNLPVSTVYRRIKKMEEDGVITGYHAQVDFEKVGRPIGVMVLIDVAEGKEYAPMKEIKTALKKHGEINELLTVHGMDFDLVAKVRLDSLKSVTPFLERVRNIEGLEDVSCAIISQELV
jgi:DNA-binding Lrp family transcriptional regulator